MRIAIAGLGLIGGSLALALRARHGVRGFDTDDATRDAARAAGLDVVDRLEALLPADAIVVATPLGSVIPTLEALARRATGTPLIDVASVRAPIEAFSREAADGTRLVGLHPMAGRAAQGFANADADLLKGRPFLVVPTPRADSDAVAIAGAIARDAGGVVTVCSAEEHDRIVALLSALPLALAAALAVTAADGVAGELAAFAGPAFRDATRVAATPPDLGEQLLTANAANVVAALARLRATLDEIERAVAERDRGALRDLLSRAATARGRLE